jgi:hypothetical protein
MRIFYYFTRSAEREQERLRRRANTINVDFIPNPCPTCGSLTHRSTRSRECPAHAMSTKELLQARFGVDYGLYTRKCSFAQTVRPQFQETLLNCVTQVSSYLRVVIIRTQMLVKTYLLQQDGQIDPICFTQQFFYSAMQIVRGERISTGNRCVPRDPLAHVWAILQFRFPSLHTPLTTNLRASDVLSEAAVTLATSYSNNVVLTLEGRLISYLQYKLSSEFQVSWKKVNRWNE